jgi:hypothetical protein
VGDGATLRNSTSSDADGLGGGAILHGPDANGTTVTMKGGTIRNCSSNSDGGAISSYAGGTTVIEGGTIVGCSALGHGGAVYLRDSGSKAEVKGGTIEGCNAAFGGGIYLDGGAVLELQGSPAFSSNYSTDRATYGAYGNRTNGQDRNAYAGGRVRADLFVEEFKGSEPVESIVLAGTVNAADGSIWVWCEPDHYLNGDQFAVVAEGATVGSNCYSVFRNARADVDTRNESDSYLTGVVGPDVNGKVCVYWGPVIEGVRHVILRKAGSPAGGNGPFTSLEGAQFQIHGSSRAVIAGGDAPLVAGANGVFYIGDLAFGTYYVHETVAPSGYAGDQWFELKVGEDSEAGANDGVVMTRLANSPW